MGVGGYFSTKAERDNYRYLLRQTRDRVERSCSGALERELLTILGPYGFTAIDVGHIAQRLRDEERRGHDEMEGNPDIRGLTSFLLKFGEGVETISTWRIYASALTIGCSYFIGGLIPMVTPISFSNLTMQDTLLRHSDGLNRSFCFHRCHCRYLTLLW